MGKIPGESYSGIKVYVDRKSIHYDTEYGYGIVLFVMPVPVEIDNHAGEMIEISSIAKYFIADCKHGIISLIADFAFNQASLPSLLDKSVSMVQYPIDKLPTSTELGRSPIFNVLCPNLI